MADNTTNDDTPQMLSPMGGMGDMDMVAQMPGSTPGALIEQPTANAGETAVSTFGGVISAQRVAVPRNPQRIMQAIKVLSAMAGETYVYSWPVKDRRNNRTTTIEGPTIKLANDLAREYGNCVVDVRTQDDGTHTIFYARFTDIETGYSLTRPFRQRKNQKTGMKDQDRADDIIFQIGASKATRNVIVNALSTYVNFAVEESKKNLLGFIQKNGEKAQNYITGAMEKFNINPGRIEAVIGRVRKDWTVRDISRVMMDLRGIEDGMSVADELFPNEADAKKLMASKQADKADVKKEPAKKAKAKPKAKPKTEPADTKPEKDSGATVESAENKAIDTEIDPETGEVGATTDEAEPDEHADREAAQGDEPEPPATQDAAQEPLED